MSVPSDLNPCDNLKQDIFMGISKKHLAENLFCNIFYRSKPSKYPKKVRMCLTIVQNHANCIIPSHLSFNYTVAGNCKLLNSCRTRTTYLEENDITNAQWGFIRLNILSNKK